MNYFALIVFIFSMSCSLEKNPLKGYPENVAKGEPAGKVGKENQKLSADTLLLSMEPQNPVFVEQELLKIQLTPRVLELNPNYISSIKIETFRLPEGAHWDASSNTVSWVPGAGFLTGTQLQKMLSFDAKLNVIYQGERLTILKSFVYWVRRSEERAPEVIEISAIERLLEGASAEFYITVFDPDSGGDEQSPVSQPSLEVVRNNSEKDASSLVSIDTNPTYMSPQKWRFTAKIQTGSRELTHSEDSYSFSVLARSELGAASAPKDTRFMIATNLEPTQITQKGILKFSKSEERSYSFQIYSQKEEGTLSVNFSCEELASASCQCLVESSVASCQVSWKPSADTAIESKTLYLPVSLSTTDTNIDHTHELNIEITD